MATAWEETLEGLEYAVEVARENWIQARSNRTNAEQYYRTHREWRNPTNYQEVQNLHQSERETHRAYKEAQEALKAAKRRPRPSDRHNGSRTTTEETRT